MTDTQPEALRDGARAMRSARWYMVNRDGMATLCIDRADAEREAADAQRFWPHMGPHRAVQLVEAADVEAMRSGYDAARLEIESLQARIKTMAEEHADELMVAHLDGRMRAAQPTPQQAAESVLEVTHKGRCQHCIDRHDGIYGSWAAPCPYHDDDGNPRIDAARAALASTGQAPAQAAPELTETAVTAKNPAAPVSSFEDSRTQAVYEVLVNDNYPPAGGNEHWEGWKARLIVDALFPIEAPATVVGDAPEVLDIPDQCPYFGPSPHREVWLEGWYAACAAQKGKK